MQESEVWRVPTFWLEDSKWETLGGRRSERWGRAGIMGEVTISRSDKLCGAGAGNALSLGYANI